jgi:segregation and condensation protein A
MEETTYQQEQVQDLLFSKEIGWQDIIYDLINTEQLDPWNIDIVLLTNKYLEKIQEMEKADFFISSKVLLAASFLLRIKSEMILNRFMKSIYEILFGKKPEKEQKQTEKFELDEEIPMLIPRSPIPRYRKVTLKELIESLNKAITTENRRIKKEITKSNALRESSISLPKSTQNIKERIKELHLKLKQYFKINQKENKITYTYFAGENKEEKIACFSPLLHLENTNKIWMHQEKHFEEIDIWLKHKFIQINGDPYKELEQEVEEITEEIEENLIENIDEISNELKN